MSLLASSLVLVSNGRREGGLVTMAVWLRAAARTRPATVRQACCKIMHCQRGLVTRMYDIVRSFGGVVLVRAPVITPCSLLVMTFGA